MYQSLDSGGILHHRAKMTIDRTLSDEFLVQYTLLKLRKINFIIQLKSIAPLTQSKYHLPHFPYDECKKNHDLMDLWLD